MTKVSADQKKRDEAIAPDNSGGQAGSSGHLRGMDARVLELSAQLMEIEQQLIPSGLHIFGQPPNAEHLPDLLAAVASFDRTDASLVQGEGTTEVRALTDLIAEGLGYPAYSVLIDQTGSSELRVEQRVEVESLLRKAIELFVSGGTKNAAAGEFLLKEATVPLNESARTFALLGRVRDLLARSDEMDALVAALRGDYIQPGPGADIVQNPGVLPTGRNTHAVNPYTIPSALAVSRSGVLAEKLLDRYRNENGRYPESIAMVLWGIDNIKTQGEAVAQALALLGVRPRRDSLNRATDVEVVALEKLGRPRIDVVMTVSGIFRDLFSSTMMLLDKAVKAVAELDEPDDMNYVAKHVKHQLNGGSPFEDAAARIFSNAAGNYGTNVNFMVLDGQWESGEELGDLFVARKCFVYSRGREVREARHLLDRALAGVEMTYQSIDSIEVGVIDVDHYFEYLGGVTRAVEQRSGTRPVAYVSDSNSPAASVRTIEETIQLETRTKTLNPKWYESMLAHGFSGVAEIEHRVTNTFGWSATAGAVDKWIYDEVAETFVFDEAMLERLRSTNPYSTRSLIGRLLEARARGLWAADEKSVGRLKDTFDSIDDQIEGVGK